MNLLVGSCVVFFLLLLCHVVKLVKVTVEQGVLEGQVLVPSTGKGQYYSFKGIPYARKPLGKFRFRAPGAPRKWKGIRNASEHGPICVQYKDITKINPIIGSEDCLYLNVYSPNLSNGTSLPVMFFIHGGLFITGSGNSDFYAPDFLMEYNVVLVTINYRLHALGFLSVDTETIPGNAGLKDQVAAMKWVQKNIRSFGGDPKKVTIFGNSVGGVSVTFHMLSPAAKGLFHRAIAMSGVVFNDWSISFEHKKRAFALGRKLGLNTENSKELIKFLQGVPAHKLLSVYPNVLISDEISNRIQKLYYFTPIVEKKFNNRQYLTDSPNDLLSKGMVNEVEFMAGHTQSEGLLTISQAIDTILEYYPQFEQLYVPLKISNIRSPEKVLKLGRLIREKYITNNTIPASIKGFVDYVSYAYYINEIFYFFDRFSKVNSKKQYFYSFDVYSSRNFYSMNARKFGIKQATHLDDIPYLFDGTSYNMTVNTESKVYRYIHLMCKLFTDFAKYGNPTPVPLHDFNWLSYDQKMSFASITDKIKVSSINLRGNLGFWRKIYDDAGVVPYIN